MLWPSLSERIRILSSETCHSVLGETPSVPSGFKSVSSLYIYSVNQTSQTYFEKPDQRVTRIFISGKF